MPRRTSKAARLYTSLSAFVDGAVAGGAEVVNGMEGAGEVEGIVVADLVGDGFDRQLGGVEELAGAMESEANEIVHGSVAGVLFEESGEMGGGHPDERGEIGHAPLAIKVAAQVFDGLAELFTAIGWRFAFLMTEPEQAGEEVAQGMGGMTQLRGGVALFQGVQQFVDQGQGGEIGVHPAHGSGGGDPEFPGEGGEQGADGMEPVDGPWMVFIGSVGMGLAGGQDEKVAGVNGMPGLGGVAPAATGGAEDEDGLRRAVGSGTAMPLCLGEAADVGGEESVEEGMVEGLLNDRSGQDQDPLVRKAVSFFGPVHGWEGVGAS